MIKALKQIVTGALFGVLISTMVIAPVVSQTLLPNAKQQYLDALGNPVAAGTVDYYAPGGNVRKNVWSDIGKTNVTNPVILDAAGHPQPTGQTYGSGSYRQVVKDADGNPIWDAVTASTDGGGGGGSTPTVGDGQLVGSVQIWGGMIAPPQYVFAYGQPLIRASYPEFFAAMTSNQNVTCTTGSPTLSGLSDTSQFPIGAKIESTCLNSGSTVVSLTSTTVTASSNAIISSSTSARFFPWGNGNGTTTFNVPDMRGRVPAGRDNMGGIAANTLTSTSSGFGKLAALGAVGGAQNQVLDSTQIPAHTHPNTATSTDSGHAHGPAAGRTAFVTFQPGAGANTIPAGTNYQATDGVTGTGFAAITTTMNNAANTGGGGAHSLVQPTAITNYVIKVTPDTNANSFFGVASIGGMFGVITCGTGVDCSGNNISVVNAVPTLTIGATAVSGASNGNLLYNNAGVLGELGTLPCGKMPALIGDVTSSLGTCGTSINTNSLTNSKLAQAGPATLKGNPTIGTADVSDFTIQGLPNRGGPDAVNDKLLLWNAATGAYNYVTPGAIASAATAGVASINGITGAMTATTGVKTVGSVIQQDFTVSGAYTGNNTYAGTTVYNNNTTFNGGSNTVNGSALFNNGLSSVEAARFGGVPWFDVKLAAHSCPAAVGDNVTDDTSAIQCHINYMATTYGGGTVYFPGGNYKITSTLTISHPIMLVGMNRNISVLVTNGDIQLLHFAVGANAAGLQDIWLVGYQSSAASANTVRIDDGIIEITFVRTKIWGGNWALQNDGTDGNFLDCSIMGAGSGGGGILSTGANWYDRVKLDSIGFTVLAAFVQNTNFAHPTQIQENHFINSDFSLSSTYSVLISDANNQAYTVFQGSVFSQPFAIAGAFGTLMTGMELGGNGNSANPIAISGSGGIGAVSISGAGTRSCAANLNITC